MRGTDESDDLKARGRAVTVSEAIADVVANPSAAEIAAMTAAPRAETARRESAASIGRFVLLRKLGEGGMLSTMALAPGTIIHWITLVIAIAGVIALAALPQYLAEFASFTMNLTVLGYLISWHRSAKIAPSNGSIR